MRLVYLLVLVLSFGCLTEQEEFGDGSSQDFEAFRGEAIENENGTFLIDGDLPIGDEKQLRDYFDRYVSKAGEGLAVATTFAGDSIWDSSQKRSITYCVHQSAERRSEVIAAMQRATEEWESFLDIDFIYLSSEDVDCSNRNNNVVFDVDTVRNQRFLASAFFPYFSRRQRSVLIDASAFRTNALLHGVLLHELGHALGFRHEHARRTDRVCPEDNNWRALTEYDRASVMHYRHCGGSGSYIPSISSLDRQGAQSVYGIPNEALAPPREMPISDSGVERSAQEGGAILRGKSRNFGPFSVKPGSLFLADMSGTGDPDLYVGYSSDLSDSSFVCRPYSNGADERCRVDIPADITEVYVRVHAYADANFLLNLEWVEESAETPSGQRVRSLEDSGALSQGEEVSFSAFSVRPGSTFIAEMNGTGDADIYIAFSENPSHSNFVCRPYESHSNERCEVSVPVNVDRVYLAVKEYRPSTYALHVLWSAP